MLREKVLKEVQSMLEKSKEKSIDKIDEAIDPAIWIPFFVDWSEHHMDLLDQLSLGCHHNILGKTLDGQTSHLHCKI
jgi:hypothetical protein